MNFNQSLNNGILTILIFFWIWMWVNSSSCLFGIRNCLLVGLVFWTAYGWKWSCTSTVYDTKSCRLVWISILLLNIFYLLSIARWNPFFCILCMSFWSNWHLFILEGISFMWFEFFFGMIRNIFVDFSCMPENKARCKERFDWDEELFLLVWSLSMEKVKRIFLLKMFCSIVSRINKVRSNFQFD